MFALEVFNFGFNNFAFSVTICILSIISSVCAIVIKIKTIMIMNGSIHMSYTNLEDTNILITNIESLLCLWLKIANCCTLN